jgi:hypothetical protein
MRTVARLTIALAIAVTLPTLAAAQDAPKRALAIGFEVDALPYINSGYYGSVWLGHEHLRYRAIVTRTDLPGFIVADGFDDANLNVVAAIVDYFPRRHFNGPWIGIGVERWRTSARYKADGARGRWNNSVGTIGGGYVWKFAGNLYLNPWVAGHLVLDGPTKISIGGGRYKAQRATPEASLKLGWYF